MNSIQNENNAIQRHVRFVKWRRDPGAVQTEFKVICIVTLHHDSNDVAIKLNYLFY